MKIAFCGASNEIGASCILLKIDGKNILLDSGIRINADPLPDFRVIQDNGGVDCIIVSHAHMDHTGSLPAISREYPSARLFMTHPTKDITRTLLYDSLKIMNYRETEIPVFSENDVLEMLGKITTHNFLYTFKPFDDKDIQVTFYPAGHIAGATCIYIQGNEGSLFYTGDFAAFPQKTVSGADIPKLRPDVMITESTYGDKLHSNRKTEEEKLVEMVKHVTERGGKVLIPAFAVGRAQEVILILKSAINKKELPPIPVYVDGMVRDICTIYKSHPNYLKNEVAKKIWCEKDVFYSDEVQMVTTQEMRTKIIQQAEPCCIISSSGMLTGGYSVFYAEKLSKNEKNYIAITGYQDEESPGRGLLDLAESNDKEKLWSLGEKNIPLSCEFGKYSLSAHGDKGEIMGLIDKLQPRKLFLIHGSPSVISSLGKELQTQETERRREIFIPKNAEIFEINFHNPRKQFERINITSLNKNSFLGKENLKELWENLLTQERTFGYTTEELIYIWSGKENVEESVFHETQKLINESIYFEPEERRLFLFHPVKKENLPSENDKIFMEGNKVLETADIFFPYESGLYKKGLRNDQKIVILSFNFPPISVSKYHEELNEFEQITGWKTEINNEYNLSAINLLIAELLGIEEKFISKTSYFKLQNTFRLTLSQQPSNEDRLEKVFAEKTGLILDLDYPGKFYKASESEKAEIQPVFLMAQTEAVSLIEMVFSQCEDKLYKKSVKNDYTGKYIELSFITPLIAEKYKEWIEDLQKESGWRIKINQSSNQIDIIQKAITLFRNEQVVLKKNPGVIESDKIARVKLSEPVSEEKIQKIQTEFLKITGFRLECLLH